MNGWTFAMRQIARLGRVSKEIQFQFALMWASDTRPPCADTKAKPEPQPGTPAPVPFRQRLRPQGGARHFCVTLMSDWQAVADPLVDWQEVRCPGRVQRGYNPAL